MNHGVDDNSDSAWILSMTKEHWFIKQTIPLLEGSMVEKKCLKTGKKWISFLFTYSSLFFYLSVEQQRRNKFSLLHDYSLTIADTDYFHMFYFCHSPSFQSFVYLLSYHFL